MSADARVARAIQQIRALEATQPREAACEWLGHYGAAVDNLIDEAKDALHLTDDDIDRY